MDRDALTTRLDHIKMLLEDSTMKEETRAQLNELVAGVEELLAKPNDVQTTKAS